MPWAGKGRSGNHQDIELLGILCELPVISNQGFWEQIEGTLGLYAGESDIGEMVVKEIPVPLVDIHIHLGIQAPADDPLEQGGGVHKAQDPIGHVHGLGDGFEIVHAGIGDDIADPLPGQGQGFAVGIADEGIPVILQHIRHMDPVIADFPVRLIRNQVNAGPQLLLLFFQQGSQALDDLLGIDDPGGVVGRVDEDGLGLGRDGPAEGREVRFEVGDVRRHHHQLAAVVAHVAAVFHEIRGKGDHFVTRVQQGFQEHIETPGGTAGHEDVVLGEGHLMLPVQEIRDFCPNIDIAGIVHVAVNEIGAFFIEDVENRLFDSGRRLHIGAAQAEIVHIFRPVDGCQFFTLFKHGSDH